VAGCIRAPFLDLAFRAARGLRGWRGRERLSVSTRPPAEAVVACEFPFRQKSLLPRFLPAFEEALVTFEDLRRPGAASLDLAWTAEGAFEGFFELGLATWDVAGVVLNSSHVATGNILAGSPSVQRSCARSRPARLRARGKIPGP